MTDRAKMASRIEGSATAATVIARLDPIPPNAVPVSTPARAKNTVPRSSRYTTANRSPTWSSADRVVMNGTIPATSAEVATKTRGAIEKTQLAFDEMIRSLPTSLRMSRQGWVRGGPARPSSRARTRLMTPTSSGAPTKATTTCDSAAISLTSRRPALR